MPNNKVSNKDPFEVDEYLLSILACPSCKGDLEYDRENSELICHQSKLAFKVEDGIPIMLIDEARKLSES